MPRRWSPPSPLDPHCDHEAVAAAARRVAGDRPRLRVLFYPVWSRWTAPGRRAPVPTGTRALGWARGCRDAKRAAILAHASQRGAVVRDDPDGFAMPEGFAAHFAATPEIYFGPETCFDTVPA